MRGQIQAGTVAVRPATVTCRPTPDIGMSNVTTPDKPSTTNATNDAKSPEKKTEDNKKEKTPRMIIPGLPNTDIPKKKKKKPKNNEKAEVKSKDLQRYREKKILLMNSLCLEMRKVI